LIVGRPRESPDETVERSVRQWDILPVNGR
jgi:hypothetical protein